MPISQHLVSMLPEARGHGRDEVRDWDPSRDQRHRVSMIAYAHHPVAIRRVECRMKYLRTLPPGASKQFEFRNTTLDRLIENHD